MSQPLPHRCDDLVARTSGAIFAALVEIHQELGPDEAAQAADDLVCVARHLKAEILGERAREG